MNALWWWITDAVSSLLEAAEREAVCGDLVEAGEPGARALGDVLGLVARRDAAQWKRWGPWLALFGVVLLLGAELSLESLRVSGGLSLHLWILANRHDIDPNLLAQTHLQLGQGLASAGWHALLVGVWAWLDGFALGALSRGAVRLNGLLFIAMAMAGALLLRPQHASYWVNGAAFARPAESVVLPLIVTALAVLVPSLWGMRRGTRGAMPLWQAGVLAAMVASMMLSTGTRGLGWLRAWPAVYIVVAAARRMRSVSS
jgi:hypothetical protein